VVLLGEKFGAPKFQGRWLFCLENLPW